jgi:thioredoxin reductase
LQRNHYDIAIIGGGPAGLQAALVLARTRKNIIVFDDPQPPRNGASHGVHNFLGVDGLRPAEIRELAWKQINVYQSTELCHEQVTTIEKGTDSYFDVTTDQGTLIRATHVVLASGYRDIHPTLAGFAECWGDTIIPCPFCDGYENRDRVWGVVASSELYAHHFPKMVQNWTSDVKLLLQPGVSIDFWHFCSRRRDYANPSCG